MTPLDTIRAKVEEVRGRKAGDTTSGYQRADDRPTEGDEGGPLQARAIRRLHRPAK